MKSKKAFAKQNRGESEFKRKIKKVQSTVKKWNKKKFFDNIEEFV